MKKFVFNQDRNHNIKVINLYIHPKQIFIDYQPSTGEIFINRKNERKFMYIFYKFDNL